MILKLLKYKYLNYLVFTFIIIDNLLKIECINPNFEGNNYRLSLN